MMNTSSNLFFFFFLPYLKGENKLPYTVVTFFFTNYAEHQSSLIKLLHDMVLYDGLDPRENVFLLFFETSFFFLKENCIYLKLRVVCHF